LSTSNVKILWVDLISPSVYSTLSLILSLSKLSQDKVEGQPWRERVESAAIFVELHGNFVNYLNVGKRTHISSKSSITG
jgi:hypothetical protein